jgi:hypothetical protein
MKSDGVHVVIVIGTVNRIRLSRKKTNRDWKFVNMLTERYWEVCMRDVIGCEPIMFFGVACDPPNDNLRIRAD